MRLSKKAGVDFVDLSTFQLGKELQKATINYKNVKNRQKICNPPLTLAEVKEKMVKKRKQR